MPEKTRKKIVFEPYITESELVRGVQSGKYLIGKLHVPLRYALDRTFVQNIELFPREMDICIENRSNRNRAFDNDIVAVEIIGWTNKPRKEAPGVEAETADIPCFADTKKDLVESDEVDQKAPRKNIGQLAKACARYTMPQINSWEEEKQPLGRVVKIIDPRPQLIIGRVQPEPDISKITFFKVKPYDPKQPISTVFKRDIPHKILENIDDHLLLLRVLPGKWRETDNYANGSFVKSLGHTGSVQAESAAILSKHGVSDEDFTEAVMDSVVKDYNVPPLGKTCDNRRDLRETEFICSIDPATARDLDDALSIRKLENGHFKVGVHIADVTAYVPEGAAVDVEAHQRATSCYITERVIPMLPRALSEDKCSLNTSEDKFAFSIMWELDKFGKIVPNTEWIGKTIVRNNCQLAYENAQKIIENTFEEDEKLNSLEEKTRGKVVESVKNLWSLAKQIRRRRFDGGSISLDFPKLFFVTDNNDTALAPIRFGTTTLKEANFLVEEFMLLANQRVAMKLYSYLPAKALVRKHDAPDPKRLRFFKSFVESKGIDIRIDSVAAFAKSVRDLVLDTENGSFVCAMLLRSMQRAEYCLSNGKSEPTHHFALNMPLYTHFTSPIRRYADLHVHRLLAKVLDFEKKRKSEEESEIEGIPPVDCSHINDKAQRAQDASERSRDLFVCLYLENLRKVALENEFRTEPYRTTPACIVKMLIRKKMIVLYIPEITCFVDITLDDRRQLWKEMKIGEGEVSVSVHWAEIEKLSANNGKLNADIVKKMKELDIKQKGEDETDISALPKITLLDQLTVSLIVGTAFPMKLHAVIHPPSLHDKALPVHLLDTLRQIQ